MPAKYCRDSNQLIDELIQQLGKELVIALPLGLGKPVPLVNALYQRAKQDKKLQLTFLTALSLDIPLGGSDLKSRFLQPSLKRIYQGVPRLEYMADLSANLLPPNVTIKEFFFSPGSRIGNFHAQYHYISSNYTHAARDVFYNGCNVVLQMVASAGEADSRRLSMSCNPDTSLEMIGLLRESGRKFRSVAVINEQLPFMCGDAEVAVDEYDLILEGGEHSHALFSVPKLPPVSDVDYLIGLNASALVPDGGTLQIGIGSLGDAVAYALSLRQSNNAAYRESLIRGGVMTPDSREMIRRVGGTGVFRQGLYGATEMFVEGFLHLIDAGVLKREVYDFWALQQLINSGQCDPGRLDIAVLEGMADLGVREIRGKDFAVLQHHGLFNAETHYHNGYITAPDGTRVAANVADPHSRRVFADQCMGASLRNGHLLHGGFFLGSRDFYQRLKTLPDSLRHKINMTGVDKINQLDLNPRLYRAQRVDARFINTGLKATLNGAVVSDTLETGQVLSGVGGQYNFVAMAHQLLTGRSIMMIRSVRESVGHSESNIVWEYGSCTIPRHLRDFVVTEYGIADLRGKSDGEVIKAMLNIADSRFQQNLLARAISAGKIEPDYVIPAQFANNTPKRIKILMDNLRRDGHFSPFPFGTDFTQDELAVAGVLKQLQAMQSGSKWTLLLNLLAPTGDVPSKVEEWLEILGVSEPASLKERVLKKLLVRELQKVL